MITAEYSGDGVFSDSLSNPFTQTVLASKHSTFGDQLIRDVVIERAIA